MTLAIVLVLLWEFLEARVPTLVGALGAFSLTATLWLVDTVERPSVAFLSGLLTIPIAVGLLGGPFLMGMGIVDEIFPVPDSSLLSLGSLILLGYVGVVVGCTVGILGITLGKLDTVTADSLEKFSNAAFVTGIAPGLVGILFAVAVTAGGGGAGPGDVLREIGAIVASIFFSTTPAAASLGSFLLTLALAIGGIRLAMATLPIEELLESDDETAVERRLDRVAIFLTIVFIPTAVVGGVLVTLGLLVADGPLEGGVVSSVAGALGGFTTLLPLRILLFVLGVLTLGVALVGKSARQYAQLSDDDGTRRIAALASGFVLTVVAILVADPLYAALVAEVVERIPAMVEPQFESQATAIAQHYGQSTIIVLLTGALIGMAGFVGLGVRLFVGGESLFHESSGYSMASGGIFVGTVFGATVGLNPLFVFVGVAASFVVWDAGRFGTTLGHEVGRQSSHRRTELVHATGTILVGCVGVVAALGAVTLLEFSLIGQTTVEVVALGALLVGLLALVEALRSS